MVNTFQNMQSTLTKIASREDRGGAEPLVSGVVPPHLAAFQALPLEVKELEMDLDLRTFQPEQKNSVNKVAALAKTGNNQAKLDLVTEFDRISAWLAEAREAPLAHTEESGFIPQTPRAVSVA